MPRDLGGGGGCSSGVGPEEDTLVDDPALPVSHVLSGLARHGPRQLYIVVVEAGDPLVKEVVGVAHLLGLFSNQVLLDFSALVVG